MNASFGTKLMVANGVVMSKLVYLITVWGGAQQYLLSAVQVQQIAAARAVCGFGCWRWSKKKLLDRVGWLLVRQYSTTQYFRPIRLSRQDSPNPCISL